MKTIQTETHIEVSPAKVWKTLVGFAAFQEWNPFIQSIQGMLKPGEKLVVLIQLPGNSAMKFTRLFKRFPQIVR